MPTLPTMFIAGKLKKFIRLQEADISANRKKNRSSLQKGDVVWDTLSFFKFLEDVSPLGGTS